MIDWTDEWLNEWIDEWLNEWMHECMNENVVQWSLQTTTNQNAGKLSSLFRGVFGQMQAK